MTSRGIFAPEVRAKNLSHYITIEGRLPRRLAKDFLILLLIAYYFVDLIDWSMKTAYFI